MRPVLRCALTLSLLMGCSCGGPASGSPSGSTTATPSAAPADYEVHEWGLIRAQAGDVLRVGATPPAIRFQAITIDKPVLYFHTSSPITLDRVHVRMGSGSRITEVWPLVPFDLEAQWAQVRLDPSGACTPSALPRADQAPCASLPAGDICESSALAVVRTSEAACVHVGGAQERFLFYRGEATQFTPPLVFERAAIAGQVQVRNEGELPIPGLLVRIRTDGRRTEALAVAPPAPGQTLTVGSEFAAAAEASRARMDDTRTGDSPVRSADEIELPQPPPGPSTVAPARDAIRDAMRELGLTDAEASVFLDAWSAALFPHGAEVAIDVLSDGDDGLGSVSESFLYFLPPERTVEIATLSFDPAPRAVRRAIAVWSPLRARGASH